MEFLKNRDSIKISYLGYGILVGIISGTTVSIFRWSIETLENIMPSIYTYLRSNLIALVGWIILVTLLSLLVYYFIKKEPHISAGGVAELKAQMDGYTKLNWLSVLFHKFFGSLIVLGLGLPVGREGPSLMIGGVTAQGINELIKGDKSQENILVSSGVAAAFAAAFDAPLTALLLVLEEVHHRFSVILILSVFSASVVSSYLAINIFGTEPATNLNPTPIFPLEEALWLVLFGIVIVIGGSLFQRYYFFVGDFYESLPIPKYISFLLPFLLVIVTGLTWPEMLGGGTHVIRAIMDNQYSLGILVAVLAFRIIGFGIAFGTKVPAGSFIPMLTIGSLVGVIFGNLIIPYSSLTSSHISNFVIYGMAGFVAVVWKSPLTGIVLSLELTGSITQILPISIVCLTAFAIADIFGMKASDEITINRMNRSNPIVFEGSIMEITIFIEPHSKLDGATLKEFSFPYNSQISKIIRQGGEFIPHRDTVFFSGDEVRVSVDRGFVKPLKEYLDDNSQYSE